VGGGVTHIGSRNGRRQILRRPAHRKEDELLLETGKDPGGWQRNGSKFLNEFASLAAQRRGNPVSVK